jgi:hypothetical protein
MVAANRSIHKVFVLSPPGATTCSAGGSGLSDVIGPFDDRSRTLLD